MLRYFNLVAAQEFWAAQTAAQRQKILDALKADLTIANNEFAALPPEIQDAVYAGMSPPSRAAEEDAAPAAKKKGSS